MVKKREKILVSGLRRHDHRSVGCISGSDRDNVPSRPRPKRDPSDSAHTIPVVSGTRVVRHV